MFNILNDMGHNEQYAEWELNYIKDMSSDDKAESLIILNRYYTFIGSDETLDEVIDNDSSIADFLLINVYTVEEAIERYRIDKRDDGPKTADETLNSAISKMVNELTWRGMLEEATYIKEMHITPRIKASKFNTELIQFYTTKLMVMNYDVLRAEEIAEVLFNIGTIKVIVSQLIHSTVEIRDIELDIKAHNLYTSNIKT